MKFWNNKLKCWWGPEGLRIEGGKIYQCYLIDADGEHWIDVTEYIEVRR